jgi:hypothetical protein
MGLLPTVMEKIMMTATREAAAVSAPQPWFDFGSNPRPTKLVPRRRELEKAAATATWRQGLETNFR